MSQMRFNFSNRPEPCIVEFDRIGIERPLVDCLESIHHFAFHRVLENVAEEEGRDKIGHPQFLADFAPQSRLHVFAIIDMSAYRRIPFTRLNIFRHRTFL